MNTTNMHIPSNKVRDIERYFITELSNLYPEGEIHSMCRLLFSAYLGWDLPQLLLHRNDTINQSDLLRFHWAVEDLKQYRPIQHIIGYTDFCDCRITVSPDVLIPRPETAEIVDTLSAQIAQPRPNILDLCTGSGCIAIALAKRFPHAQVWGIDISEKALALAKKNSTDNNTLVTFLQGNVLHTVPNIGVDEFDLIVSNPPYVMEQEQTTMQPNVLNYDPHIALFVPDSDPLLFYRPIAAYAMQHLSPKGLLALEINEHLATETAQLIKEIGLHAECHQDFNGKPRLLLCHR